MAENRDRTYIPHPLPSNMGPHTPRSLRAAMVRDECQRLRDAKEYDKAEELAEHNRLMGVIR